MTNPNIDHTTNPNTDHTTNHSEKVGYCLQVDGAAGSCDLPQGPQDILDSSSPTPTACCHVKPREAGSTLRFQYDDEGKIYKCDACRSLYKDCVGHVMRNIEGELVAGVVDQVPEEQRNNDAQNADAIEAAIAPTRAKRTRKKQARRGAVCPLKDFANKNDRCCGEHNEMTLGTTNVTLKMCDRKCKTMKPIGNFVQGGLDNGCRIHMSERGRKKRINKSLGGSGDESGDGGNGLFAPLILDDVLDDHDGQENRPAQLAPRAAGKPAAAAAAANAAAAALDADAGIRVHDTLASDVDGQKEGSSKRVRVNYEPRPAKKSKTINKRVRVEDELEAVKKPKTKSVADDGARKRKRNGGGASDSVVEAAAAIGGGAAAVDDAGGAESGRAGRAARRAARTEPAGAEEEASGGDVPGGGRLLIIRTESGDDQLPTCQWLLRDTGDLPEAFAISGLLIELDGEKKRREEQKELAKQATQATQATRRKGKKSQKKKKGQKQSIPWFTNMPSLRMDEYADECSAGRLVLEVQPAGTETETLKAYQNICENELPSMAQHGHIDTLINKRDHHTSLVMSRINNDGEKTVVGGATFKIALSLEGDAILDVLLLAVAGKVSMPDEPLQGMGHGRRLVNYLKSILLQRAAACQATPLFYLQADNTAIDFYQKMGMHVNKEAQKLKQQLWMWNEAENPRYTKAKPMLLALPHEETAH